VAYGKGRVTKRKIVGTGKNLGANFIRSLVTLTKPANSSVTNKIFLLILNFNIKLFFLKWSFIIFIDLFFINLS
jgi:hypothetical protein